MAPVHSRTEIRRRILDADIVYVGGGNTLRMMKIWRKLGVDRALLAAGRKGAVLCWVSAGAICWFRYGNSDAMRFGSSRSAKLIRVRGIGILPFTVCPHYNTERARRRSLRSMVQKRGGVATALDDCAAMEAVNDSYRIVTSAADARAHRLFRRRGRVIEETLEPDGRFRPLSQLLAEGTSKS